MDIKKLLGNNIKQHRKSRMLTQEQLAELVGVQPQTIRALESGLRFVSESTLNALAATFKVSYEELFTFEELKTDYNKILSIELEELSAEDCQFFIEVIRLYKKRNAKNSK